MNNYFITLSLIIFCTGLFAQAIDGSFEFQTDPAKKYSLYVPSTYDADTPSALMLGLHPLNTNRWDGAAWRDTLIVFAERNNVILACPDGGIDGRIDDDIDTAFTTVLLDSMALWYNINPEERYAMGFSWGGKTTYTYALRRPEIFNGFIVIGPAATIADIDSFKENAAGKPFYLINGSLDNPSVRYTPFLNTLEGEGACVESSLLNGVNHTIDFPDRNNLLSEAYQFVRNSNCGESSTSSPSEIEIKLYPNPVQDEFLIDGINHDTAISITSQSGRSVPFNLSGNRVTILSQERGLIFVKLTNSDNSITKTIFRI